MKNSKNILQSSFSIDVGQTLENFMVLTFPEGNHRASTVVRFPEWFRFYDRKYKHYIPSLN
ncbi:MAG: hypothetical protein JXA68_00045 [Ignavibacteriales bacterium]|nr:hypothetical protein [Ignavibacteriales bacterium]